MEPTQTHKNKSNCWVQQNNNDLKYLVLILHKYTHPPIGNKSAWSLGGSLAKDIAVGICT
ncbi:type I polyketide synthase/non-ribosomal peptide synthetase [Paenibacillus popilliae ATCC 14706]|uniref:Type I polyketide synthase/non-ribosomal peptide synthetase n=1 Tax=Paenibacillus popilliae ATCC 14706 TaxID=1212764 RepID=M9LZI5_PAEPP|nr:type I polyketide synthase/non-ribosomal peptide synthetase [Paenibacillus popilliae ATCC 14706]